MGKKIFVVLILGILISCMKRNISSGIGVGAGFPPESGLAKLRIFPGNIDENVRPSFEFQGIYRFEQKDIVPSTGAGLFFEFPEIKDRIFPLFGTTLNLVYLYNREQRKWNVNSEFIFIFSVESIITKNFSLIYEIPINIARTGYTIPKFGFMIGGTFYIKR